jgi:hypothetical protein
MSKDTRKIRDRLERINEYIQEMLEEKDYEEVKEMLQFSIDLIECLQREVEEVEIAESDCVNYKE